MRSNTVTESTPLRVFEMKVIIEHLKNSGYFIDPFPIKDTFVQLKPLKSAKFLQVVASLVFRC